MRASARQPQGHETPLLTAERLLSALGSVALFLTLFLTWYAIAGDDGTIADRSAWTYLGRVDLALAALAATSLLAALIPRWPRAGAAIRVLAGVASFLLVVRAIAAPPGDDARVDLLGGGFAAVCAATAIAIGGFLDLRAGGAAGPSETRRATFVRRCLQFLPVAFAVPVAIGITTTLVHLLGTDEPNLGGWANAVLVDARAIYIGEPIYQDPDVGHSGLLYTPLHPLIIGMLHHVAYWGGWAPLVSTAASLVPAGLAAWLAYRPVAGSPLDRALALAEAVGVGAIAWFLMIALAFDFAFTGHVDQLAWALSLAGLVVVPHAARGSRRAAIASVVLLSAGFWTKQSTILVDITAVLWLVLSAWGGGATRRLVLRFSLFLLGVNLVILGLLNAVTGGWEFYFNFALAVDRPAAPLTEGWIGYLRFLELELRAGMGLSVAFALAIWIPLAVLLVSGRRSRPRGRTLRRLAAAHARASWQAQVALALAFFVAIYLPAYVQFHRVSGTFDNQAIGMAWSLGLIAAAGYHLSGRSRATALAAGGAVLALWTVTQLLPARDLTARNHVTVPPIKPVVEWEEVPPDLLRYAETHLVWHEVWSDLSARSRHAVYPNYNVLRDLTAVGRPSGYLEDAIVERRFDAIAPFSRAPYDEQADPYFSGNGRYEENYYKKINAAIAAKYEPRPRVPGGLWVRKTGPDPAPWMRHCFAPFEIDGTTWRINRGGGFWCRPGDRGSVLELRATEAPFSDIRTDERVSAVSGELSVELPGRGGQFAVELDPENGTRYTLRGVRERRGVARLTLERSGKVLARGRSELPLTATIDSRGESPSMAPGGNGRLRLTFPEPEDGALLRLSGTNGSGVRYDLRSLRLEGG